MQLLMGLLQLRRVEMVGGQRAVGMRRDDRPGDDLRREMTGPGEEFRKSLRVFGMPGDATGSPPRARPRSRSPTRGSPQQSTSSQDPTVQTMLKLMQGMQQMQQALMNQQAGRRSGADDHREDEYVRGSVELHKLAEWAPESAPVDFQDWLLVLQPQMDAGDAGGQCMVQRAPGAIPTGEVAARSEGAGGAHGD